MAAAEGVLLLLGWLTAANMLDAEWWANGQALIAQGIGIIRRDEYRNDRQGPGNCWWGHWL